MKPSISIIGLINDRSDGNEQRTDVSPQNVLDLLLLETTPDNQPPATIHTSSRTQLSEQVLNDMLRLPVHPLADITDVGEDTLLVSFPVNARRGDRVPLAG